MSKKNIALYSVLAYFFTWIITVPLALKILPEEYHFLAALGPTIGAVIIAKKEGKLKELIDSVVKVPGKFSAWLLTLAPILLGVITYAALAATGDKTTFDVNNFLLALLPVFTYGFFEEIGWRGYALNRLEKFYSPLVATVILTVIWACWHIPMFFYRFDFGSPFMVFGFLITMFFGAVLLTSTYNFSKGSTLSAILFHMGNNFISTNSSDNFMSVYSTLLIVLAVVILIWTKGKLFLNKKDAGN